MMDSFVQCRTYGHGWDEFYPTDLGPPMYGWRLSLRCVRCGTERHDTIDKKGAVGGRRYLYPDGYQKLRDEEGWDRESFRLELFKKVEARLRKSNAIADEMGKVVSIKKVS